MTTILGQDVKRAYWIAEVDYGVTPNTVLSALGNAFDISPNYNPNPEEDSEENRAYTKVGFGTDEITFSLQAKVWKRSVSPAFVPENFWALYALGLTTGRSTTGRIGSFSLLTKKASGGTNYYALWNGCVCDSLAISASAIRKALVYQMDCRAQYVSRAATKVFTGLQNMTVGNDPSLPATDYDRWNGTLPTVNYGGGASDITGVSDWKLSIKNGIAPEWQKKTGADSNPYYVAEYFDEGEFACEVDITRWHRDETHLVQLLARIESGITLTLPINEKTWTLTGGYLYGGSFPPMKSGKDPLKETLKLKFNGVSIA